MHLFVFSILIAGHLCAQDNWQQLFNGSDLGGWTQIGGSADYFVEDGAIVGRAVLNSPNSFLRTVDEYSDFILEVEVYFDTDMNSGIQIRSLTRPTYRDVDVTPIRAGLGA